MPAPTAAAPRRVATLSKMIKELLPQEMRCATDCMDLLVECCTGAQLGAAQHPSTHAARTSAGRGRARVALRRDHPPIPACTEFVQLLSSEANELATADNKSMITPEHVIRALQQLGFGDWADDVREHHEHSKSEAKREGVRRAWRCCCVEGGKE